MRFWKSLKSLFRGSSKSSPYPPSRLGSRPVQKTANMHDVTSITPHQFPVLSHEERIAERAVVSKYHSQVQTLELELRTNLSEFDAQPYEYYLVPRIRSAQTRLGDAIEMFYAAAGVRNPSSVQTAIDLLNRVDQRLRLFSEDVQGEISRFESTVQAIAICCNVGADSSTAAQLFAEANELLLEVVVYRTDRDSTISETERDRLDVIQSKLRSIIDSISASNRTHPCVSPLPMPNTLDTGDRSASSSDDGTYAHKLLTSAAGLPNSSAPQKIDGNSNTFSENPEFSDRIVNGHGTVHHGQSRNEDNSFTRSHRPEKLERPLGTWQQNTTDEDDASNIAETRADSLVMCRSRTLRDMAVSALSSDATSTDYQLSAAAGLIMPADFAQKEIDQRPSTGQDANLKHAAKSFASMLYNTRHVRSSPLSDSGRSFHRSVVRGDGRCLFRSIVRAREVARGRPLPSERFEREAADDLRQRTVVELKKHKGLLQQFYVIETDFSAYAKKMANPRTFGGEPELLMLAKIIHKPIAVYISVAGGFKQIQVYGRQYRDEPIRILYSDGIHYDALL